MKNYEVQKILTELDESNGGFFTRLLLVEGYIKELEKTNAELGWFFSCVSKLVREQTDGEAS